MAYIFWGFIFEYININITLDTCSLDLMPDFVGIILMIIGLKKLANENEGFNQLKVFSYLMFAYSVFIYVLDLSGYENYFIGILSAILYFLFNYSVVKSISEIEQRYGQDYGTKELIFRLEIGIAVELLALVLIVVMPAIGLILLIATFAIAIAILVSAYRMKCKYEL